MKHPVLYRKRLIPEECVKLKDDIILSIDEDRIVTKWNTLKPKKDLHHGYSCYFLKEGFKVSKFYKEDGSLLYWYCDIVHYSFEDDGDKLIVTDLLADVIVYPDGFVKVVDIDEMVDCLDNSKISIEQLKESLVQLDKLLSLIYAGDFEKLTRYIEVLE
ncbi:MAG: DUF402 domain-containing protein [Lachnospiraceae bacterium]|nr:DUF402 domain-containing protein [Lachnospiraceae bacterium]